MHRYQINRFFFFFWIIGVLFIGFSGPAFSDQSNEVDKLINMLESGSSKTRIDAAKIITRSGLTDPVLFETIKRKLLKGYPQASLSKSHVDEMSWFCKALASSGSTQYTATLQEVAQNASSHKLKNYAKKSIDQIPVHAKQNQLIQTSAGQNKDLTPEENKMIAMVRSTDLVLMKNAAKLTYRTPFSGTAVTDAISEELLKLYPGTSASSRALTDTLSWMCKALGASGKSQYKKTLMEVIEKSHSEKLKKYARQSLGIL